MSGRRLPPGAVSDLLAMVRDGLLYRDIADAFGVTTSVVTYHALRAGLTRRGPNAHAAPRPVAPDSPVLGLRRPPEWMDDALCAQTDSALFFPEEGEGASAAKKVCRACPVREACLDYAVAHHQTEGIWGGLTPGARRKLARQQRAAA